MPLFIAPQLCTLVDKPPSAPGWAHEIKWDGYRITARINKGAARIFTRSGLDWTSRFPTLARELPLLVPKSGYVDGELCAFDARGISDFSALQAAIGDGRNGDLVYFVFDLMFLDGADLRPWPLLDRRQLLQRLVRARSRKKWPHIQLSEEVEADGAAFFKEACKRQLEGIISKREDAPYQSGRTKTWIKIKCSPRQEFVIAGFTPNSTGRGIGALILGHYEGKELVYDGRVGTGFSLKLSLELERRLKKMAIKDCPLKKVKPADAKNAIWVRPELVCEVKFTARTAEGLLRQASFQGLREDKPARQVGRKG